MNAMLQLTWKRVVADSRPCPIENHSSAPVSRSWCAVAPDIPARAPRDCRTCWQHARSVAVSSRWFALGDFKLSCIAQSLSCPRAALYWTRRQWDENGDRAAIGGSYWSQNIFCRLWRTLQFARSLVNLPCSVLRSDFERSSENFRSDRLCISVRLRIHKSLALLCMLASCK